ncbi:hypothetical protein EGI20_12105 [Aquitalea sp. S1-19]|nr:hypothetical protein [Aquitalea sp. S1-19]
MANLTESDSWQEGVYRIETTDPVLGGEDGISNVQAKQLANRTRYLKKFADEVASARGNQPSLKARLDGYDAFAPESQVGIIAGMQMAMQLAAQSARALQEWARTRTISGRVVLKNKSVITGFALTKSDIRALHLSASGTVGAGVSRAALDGGIVAMADDDYHVSVPTNPTDVQVTLYAYLSKVGADYKVSVGDVVPDTALTLYRLTLPAGDTGGSLSLVSLTDLRPIQALNSWFANNRPSVYVPLPFSLPAADYAVHFEIESATNVNAVGQLSLASRARNGFAVQMEGSADNVVLRYTVSNPNYQ